MDFKIRKAILKTLSYSDIFSYPLTRDEIWKWLIWEEEDPPKEDIGKHLENFPSTAGFFHLLDREEIVRLRIRREDFAREKIKKAQGITYLLKRIPTIKLIGISGALAIKNTEKEDDIDLFLITKKNTLWLTRLLATLLLEIKGVRRRPKESFVRDKICLNMLLDEANLTIQEQNLYTAHEIVQMLPLWEKDDTYKKFLFSNQWVKKYLPNAISKTKEDPPARTSTFKKIFDFCILIFDFLFMFPQVWFMKKKRTKEIVSQGIIRFHPQDKTTWVLNLYKKKLKASCLSLNSLSP